MNPTEHTMRTWDGTELFYRAWGATRTGALPARGSGSAGENVQPARKGLLLFHRGHEHSGRWQETVDRLALEDVSVFAWDARGHGRSPGERGSAENLSVVIKDVDAFVRHISEKFQIPIENMVVLAHSVGAVTATAWVHDYAPPIRGLILGAPAFRVKLYVPFAVLLLRLRQKFFGHGYVKSYVKAKMLTHDLEQAREYAADPMIFRQIAVNILLDLHDTSTRLMADAGSITVPTLMLAAGSDWVVKLSAQKEFFDRLSSKVKEMEVYPELSHAIFHETEWTKVIERTRKFVLERFQSPVRHDSLLDADKHGFTKAEYDRLCIPNGVHFGLVKFGMKTLGRMSKGIQLGWQSGFDSGLTLDYVYENRPQGKTPLGRMMDRSYLNIIGRRGIRERKIHLEKILREAIERTRKESRSVRIVDIAAGAGRYVLETMYEMPQIPISALLRDYKPENVAAAGKLAQEFGLKNVTVEEGDAFDRASLASIEPRPTIGIISGLFELIPSNESVLNSLRGLADAIEPGGYLIYTNQPWHPQVEFIARVLINREGKPWIMRRRTQAEMDELARTAGFEKLAMEIDQWGIFTVSLARRMAG
jgi:alpha-beta hydrolase superfamily lysophospholipase/SAM-dependent methyltransferase